MGEVGRGINGRDIKQPSHLKLIYLIIYSLNYKYNFFGLSICNIHFSIDFSFSLVPNKIQTLEK